ncbi:hypothetical protein FRB90_012157 [Tulasnella sp. 427]|nr:hypothetical protein FRB90_012157 [Tulasnella sp. 427]
MPYNSREPDRIVAQSLERSKATGLHVRLDFHLIRAKLARQTAVLEMLWAEASRWETFLPNLREIAFCGRQRGLRAQINAPKLEMLWEGMGLTSIEDSGAPASQRLLEALRFLPHFRDSDEDLKPLEEWTALSPETKDGILFPSLKEFQFVPITLTTKFLEIIRAPNLRKLTVAGSSFKGVSFEIIVPERLFYWCPNLHLIKFRSAIQFSDIKRCLSRLPPGLLRRLEIEVEYPAEYGEQRDGLDSLYTVRWSEVK